MVPSGNDKVRQVHLLNNIRQYHKDLIQLQQKALSAYCLVHKETDITSSQCTRITNPLFPSEHPAVHLKALLEHSLGFSPIDIHRQQLLIELDQIERHIQHLQQLVIEFSNISFRRSSDDGKNTRNSILEELKNIEEKLSHFNEFLKDILDNASSSLQSTDLSISDQRPTIEEEVPSSPSDLILQSPSIEKEHPPPHTSGSSTGRSIPEPALSRNPIKFVFNIVSIINIVWNLLQARLARSKFADRRLTNDSIATSSFTTSSSTSLVKSSETVENAKKQELYEKLSNFTSALELDEICQRLQINQNRLTGASHAEKSLSLAQYMYNKSRLDDLENELRRIIPKRFPSNGPGNKQ